MNWSQPAYVYGLRFEGEEIFYIGSARNKTARMRSHSSYKENASYPYQRHIFDGMRQGKVLEMVELELTNTNDARQREAYWIWKHHGQLFNRILPSWAVITDSDGAEIKNLEDTVAACKRRIAEIRGQAIARAKEDNSKLRKSMEKANVS